MTWEVYLSFLLVSVVIIVVPGPNVTLIVTTSATQGVRAGLMALMGTTLAQILQVTLVALGLVWLVQTFSAGFEILRWIGVTYLLYLGIKAWRTAKHPLPKDINDTVNIRRGFFVGLANPKSLSFFAAFFPQFIDVAASAGGQFALLAITYVVLAIFLDAAYAVAGGFGKQFLATDTAKTMLARGSGLVLIGGGLWLAMGQKK